MRCEKTTSVKRVRSTRTLNARSAPRNCRGQHRHWCRGEVLVAHVVQLVVDAVIVLALSLIAHVAIVVFVAAILHIIFLYGRYTLYSFISFVGFDICCSAVLTL